MSTKIHPGKFRCFEAALPDEPFFVILGRDPAAPATIEHWATERVRQGKVHTADDQDRIRAAMDEAKDFAAWRQEQVDFAAENDCEPIWKAPRILDEMRAPPPFETWHGRTVRMASESLVHEWLDYATVYGAINETTPNGCIDDPLAGDDMDDVRRGIIWAYKRVLGLIPEDTAPPAAQDSPEAVSYKVKGGSLDRTFAFEGCNQVYTAHEVATILKEYEDRGALHRFADAKKLGESYEASPEMKRIFLERMKAYTEAAEKHGAIYPGTTVEFDEHPPVVDTAPEDLAHTPEVPGHRFSQFYKAGRYAYARGLEVNPIHLPTALDVMAKDGWRLLAIFGQTDSQHIGFIFERELPPAKTFAVEPISIYPPFSDHPDLLYRGRGQQP